MYYAQVMLTAYLRSPDFCIIGMPGVVVPGLGIMRTSGVVVPSLGI